MYIRTILIDEISYTKDMVLRLNNDEIKMLVSWIDNVRGLNLIKNWCENNYVIESYIDNLIAKI